MKNLLVSALFLVVVGYAGNRINNADQDPAPQKNIETPVAVHPQVSGYVDKIYVQEGDYVTSDQPLFVIKSSAGSTVDRKK